jgi:vacuolar-type H+-ATPase subunit F/Vma7
VKKIAVLAPAQPVAGFAIAGVIAREGVALELPRLIDDAIADASMGVVAIDERLLDRRGLARIRDAERHWRGAIVVVPSPTRPATPVDDYAHRLIRRAVGYQVKVQL